MIYEVVRRAKQNYVYGTTHLGKYVDWSMYETIEKIFAYINSKHTSGETDALGREKPFFNIVTAARNIWYRATDVDRKDITIAPSSTSQVVASYLATIVLQEWMKRIDFGTFLNQWGRTLADYGSAVSKFVIKDGILVPTVIPWNRLIVDSIDFNALPVIEKFYKTPAQLRKMKEYDQEVVTTLISAISSRTTLEGQKKDNQNDFIELYEVHGELPLSYLTGNDEDDNTYRQQVHIISYIQNQKSGEYDDFCLYKGREAKNPYMLSHLIEEDGRSLAIGSVESLFESQWMQNHSIKNMKDTLDISSKLIFQTADATYAGRNILSAIETGDIMVHQTNMPLTQVNNAKGDIVSLQNFATQWRILAQEITSTPDALRGNTMPSGTPFALGQFLGSQANSLFEIMIENKGLALETMLREHIIPFIKTKLDTKEEITAVLDERQIKQIDSIYLPNKAIKEANNQIKDMILAGDVVTPAMQQQLLSMNTTELQNGLNSLGNMRSFKPDEIGEKTWKEVFKDFEWKVDVLITNEMKDKQVVFTTLSTVLQTIASNPAILQDENAKMLFTKILELTGSVSPLELSAVKSPFAPPALPAMAP